MIEGRNPLAIEHEDSLIRAFILQDRVERFLYLVTDPKRRRKFVKELGHFRWFNPTFALAAKWQVNPSLPLWERHLQGSQNIVDLLRSKGATQRCWVISQSSTRDSQYVDLDESLKDISDGTVLSCIPGRLAYFKGEDEALLLERIRN